MGHRGTARAMPSLKRMACDENLYQQYFSMLTLIQRVSIRFLATHGKVSNRFWHGSQDEIDALDILTQACQVERGELTQIKIPGVAGRGL